jgi:transposase
LNSKLHAIADAKGRPIGMYLSAGQTSDYIGARALLSFLPEAGTLLAPFRGLHANHCRATDRGYDADWFCNALIERNIQPCILSRKGRKSAIPHDADLYRKRHKIENMFASLKDWRRIATRYDRCADLFLSACALATTVMFWL